MKILNTIMVAACVLPMTSVVAAEQSEFEKNNKLPRRPTVNFYVYQQPQNPKLTVSYLVGGSSAAKAGLQLGDRLVKLNGTALTDNQQFLQMTSSMKLGQKYDLVVNRGGKTISLRMKTDPFPLESAAPGQINEYSSAKTLDGNHLRVIYTHKKNASRRMPVVVIIPYMGFMPSDNPFRAGHPNPFFFIFAKMLAEEGFLAVRYDERGFGDSNFATYRSGTFKDEYSDIRAVKAAAKRHRLAQPRNIFYFSLGMRVIQMVAAARDDADIKGLISWVGSVRPMSEYWRGGYTRGSKLRNEPPENTKYAGDLVYQLHDLITNTELNADGILEKNKGFAQISYDGVKAPDYSFFGKPILPYWRDHNRFNAKILDAYKKLKCRHILSMHAEYSYMFSSEDHASIVKAAEAAKKKVTHVVIPKVTMFFNRADDPITCYRESAGSKNYVTEEVVEAAIRWLKKIS